jgi:6-phosphogluconolactonase
MLRKFFGPLSLNDPSIPSEDRRYPIFDLIILGVGKDGHTASLFPEDPVLEEKERWVVPVVTPRGSPPVPRVTLTLAVINRAKCVMFLASGTEKEEVVRSILDDPETSRGLYPAARVQPEGHTVWFVNQAASIRAGTPLP